MKILIKLEIFAQHLVCTFTKHINNTIDLQQTSCQVRGGGEGVTEVITVDSLRTSRLLLLMIIMITVGGEVLGLAVQCALVLHERELHIHSFYNWSSSPSLHPPPSSMNIDIFHHVKC